jgi:glycosyltransferase involved in cell wall biosynthesis
MKKKIVVIIPAFNEENSVGLVINAVPKDLVAEIVVVNNNSNDQTRINAIQAGATVLDEPRQGYGYACLMGIEYVRNMPIPPEIIVFLDADYSDFPEEMQALINPIFHESFDFVIGSRAMGNKEKGSMTIPQIFGNWLATTLIRFFYGVQYSDLGPFRAIRYDRLIEMNMQDKTYGWTVEMQLKAAKKGLRILEVPVSYRVRIGKSKVSGTLKGTVMAGYKILSWIFKYL